MRISFVLLAITMLLGACGPTASEQDTAQGTRFTTLDATKTGIDFVNQLDFNKDFNIYTYRNFYNGGGVAIGDLNKDGLPDVYMTANMQPNKLYLNKGDFQFEDVTEQAGVAGTRAWSTGVSIADVNADGWLDIYVCNSGDIAGDNKQNELFINNGDGTFTDRAAEFGLADQGFSTHAAFFDYDKDGDLDAYLLNNSYQAIGSFNLRKNERPKRDPVGGDKLYRNDNGKFVDVSEEAGIYGSVIGFGLGVTVGDIDRDGWLDIYVCNDFFERDYIYMNNGDGTFREDLEDQIRSISAASMGADMVDINFDGYPEIFVTEMLPEPDDRLKTTMTFENWDKYQYNVQYGYYHQFTRNMLHLNNANGTFSEIGRLVDVEATDWSWGALITDFDNDGYRDLYISNGINRDILNQDYLNFIANEEVAKSMIGDEGVDYQKLIDIIPSNRIPNYLFQGGADLAFSQKTKEWGLAEPSHSNGAAYGDLDNDGDLDLVVNNVNMPAFIYRNETAQLNKEQHYLKVRLVGSAANPYAVGANVTLLVDDKTYYSELIPTRGFQSSVDYRLHFGLGANEKVDRITVTWPDDRTTQLENVAADQELVIEYTTTNPVASKAELALNQPLFTEQTETLSPDYQHQENRYADFDRDRLIYHMISTQGPCLCKGDIDGDGLADLYAGGAKDAAGSLMLQQTNGRFKTVTNATLAADAASEDVDCRFFDADGDGDLDLYVVSGGNDFAPTEVALTDRLYFNKGNGDFEKSSQALPIAQRFESTSCVRPADYDQDGDLDLFVGTRLRPLLYGVPVNGYLLENDGKGFFTEVSKQKAPALEKLGMITDAIWSDIDRDADMDLIVVGEWMPITLFKNEGGRFEKMKQGTGLEQTAGWWNSIAKADLDGDGDEDFIVGNHGLNSRFKASVEKPVSCYVNDFDQNRTVEQIVCTYNGEKAYPLVLRHDMVTQMPQLKKQFLKYDSYKEKTIEELFAPEVLERSVVHEVTQLASVVLLSNGDGTFVLQELPQAAQFSPVYAITIGEYTGDDHLDVVLGGNLFGVKPEVGRYDASYGTFLAGKGDGSFESYTVQKSGIQLEGEVRAIVNVADKLYIARNNKTMQVFEKGIK